MCIDYGIVDQDTSDFVTISITSPRDWYSWKVKVRKRYFKFKLKTKINKWLNHDLIYRIWRIKLTDCLVNLWPLFLTDFRFDFHIYRYTCTNHLFGGGPVFVKWLIREESGSAGTIVLPVYHVDTSGSAKQLLQKLANTGCIDKNSLVYTW